MHTHSTETETDNCGRCGGRLPAPHGTKALDALDRFLVRRDGHCPGHIRHDDDGTVLGCGAWTAEAWAPSADETDAE